MYFCVFFCIGRMNHFSVLLQLLLILIIVNTTECLMLIANAGSGYDFLHSFPHTSYVHVPLPRVIARSKLTHY